MTEPTTAGRRDRNLDSVMEFDHIIEVLYDGSTQDATGVYAPSLLDGQLDSDRWTLLDGYSGQQGYRGPIMHPSEFIGGPIVDAVLGRPGYWVAIVAEYSPESNDWPKDGDPNAETTAGGWALAYMSKDDHDVKSIEITDQHEGTHDTDDIN